MVAGASGVDAALLVVAADDSAMPQTREHLALLELLGIRRGVIAISKCDLADEEQLELVELEVAELVSSTFLAEAPRIRVSMRNSQGIEELKSALVASVRSSPARATDDPRFRLPIDRAFSPAGQGAVVTGTVWQGTARVGETLHLLPHATPVRIRRLQSQGADVERIAAGERAAINLVGVKASAIRRGDELATPDAFVPARRHLVELRVLADAPHALKHRQFVRLHLGSNQTTAQVLMGERGVSVGHAAFAVVRSRTPIVAEYGQPFVLRQLSPARTIGGGRIIAPALEPTDRLQRCLAAAPNLASPEAEVRLAAFIDLRREVSRDAVNQSTICIAPVHCETVVERLIERKEIIRAHGSPPRLVSAGNFERLKRRFVRYCQTELERRRPASQVPLTVILSAMSRHASEPVLKTLLETLTARREIVRRGDRVGLPTGAALSHRQQSVLASVLAEIEGAGPTPPTLKELAEQHDYPLKDLEPLVQVAIDEGRLIRVSPLLALDRDALESLRQSLADHFRKHPTGTVSEIREQWHMTRKHAVPILEYFDQCQITRRAGDSRSPGPRISQSVEEISP
jgi:selenocysteine-specific elongation factor